MAHTSYRGVGTSGDAVLAASLFAERLVRKARDQVRLADIRAAQWLALLGAGAVAIAALWATRGATPWDAGATESILATAGCVTAVLAVAALVRALVPRAGAVPAVGLAATPEMLAEFCRFSRLAVSKSRYQRAGAVLVLVSGTLLVVSAL